MVGRLQSSSFLSWITLRQSDEAPRSIQRGSSMEHGGGDKYAASHPARCSLLVWVLRLVRYMSSESPPVKLNANTNPSRSVWAVQENIGQVIGALLSLGVFFLDFTSLGAAFISGCPFRSPSSAFIRHIFEKLQTLSKRIQCGFLSSKRLRRPWVGTLTFLWVALVAGIAYASLILPIWFPLLFLLACIPITYSTQHEHEAVHKPQKYKISLLAISVFLSISVSMILTICLDSFENPIFIALYVIETLAVISACWMFRKLSKSMADTGEIDAVAWLLTTTPPQYPATFFKKAGQMTGIDSIGRHYRPRLLESLMPLLTLLITSYHAPEHHSSGTHSPQSDDSLNGLVDDDMVPIDEDPHLKNLEIYIACLARLTDFTDCKGNFWCLREDAKQHPKLDQPLIDKLVELVDPQCHFQDSLRSAATKVLNNYKLNTEGNPLEESPTSNTSTTSTTTFLESVATDPRSEATMPNDNRLDSRERGHSELYRRVERATHVGPTTRGEPASHLGPAMRVEPASAASSMLNNSGLNSQEQGLAKMYRPVDPAMCVEPEESEIGDEEIEEVMRDSA